ncbi:MAG TPA: SulP family inorganic anion transporter [Acidimicrobiales bacterium]|nr:SulP family inorganic anion transporter [Acidimicrobiales bacterium]
MIPRRSDYQELRHSWRQDLLAGVTVGIVALPLALAFGVASGLGPGPGLVTAIVAGLVAGIFGGSHVQVSGPTGAMVVVLAPLVARHGADAVVVVGVLAGVVLVAAAALRLGRLLDYIPWPVVEGFTLGIAVIIALQQVPLVVGATAPEPGNSAVVAVRAVADAWGPDIIATMVIVGIVIAVMVVAPRFRPSLPASLPAVLVATAVALFAGLPIPAIGELPSALPSFRVPDVGFGDLGRFLPAALAVAALAGIESLLAAKVADGMTDVPPHEPSRELFGQGLANIAASLSGGMPATGAIARTAVNIRARARTRLSSVTHSVFLLVVVVAGSGLVAHIPLAALAAVLIMTAYRMVGWRRIREVLGATRTDATVLAITAIATIAFDLVIAVLVGIAVAVVLTIVKILMNGRGRERRGLTRTFGPGSLANRQVIDTPATPVGRESEASASVAMPDGEGRVVAFKLQGPLHFGVAHRLVDQLERTGDAEVVILRLPEVPMIDATGARALGEVTEELESRGVTVLLKGLQPDHERLLGQVGMLDRLATRKHVFADLGAATDHARHHLGGRGPTFPGKPDRVICTSSESPRSVGHS